MSLSIGCSTASSASLAERLFAKLDAKNQGYLSKSDLAQAMAGTTAATASVDAASDTDAVFGALDADGDGKVTKQEFSDVIDQLAEQLGMQRLAGGGGPGGARGAGGPPPEPPPDDDAGLDETQLSAMADDASGTDEASALKSLVTSFDEADTNGDGKVSMKEAQAFREKTEKSDAANDPDAGADPMLRGVLGLIARYAEAAGTAGAQPAQVSVSA